jgi:hypothetical protein
LLCLTRQTRYDVVSLKDGPANPFATYRATQPITHKLLRPSLRPLILTEYTPQLPIVSIGWTCGSFFVVFVVPRLRGTLDNADPETSEFGSRQEIGGLQALGPINRPSSSGTRRRPILIT